VHPVVKINTIGNFEDRVNASRLMMQNCELPKNNLKSSDDLKCYVGTYAAKTEDIFVNLAGCGEDELMINPENVKLLRYDPVAYS
jgi:hypothetical protein